MRVEGGPGRLTLVRPPHPATTALLWLFSALAVALTAWFAGGGLQIDCARSRGDCQVRTPGGERLALAISRVEAVSVAPSSGAQGQRRSLVITTREGNLTLGSTPVVRAEDLELAAKALDVFFRQGQEELFGTWRNWPLALEIGGPFAVVAALIALVRRRRFRLTLEVGGGEVQVRRQTLLSTSRAPILPRAALVEVDAADAPAPGARRLVLRLPDGRSFAVSPWSQSPAELEETRRQLDAFLDGAGRPAR